MVTKRLFFQMTHIKIALGDMKIAVNMATTSHILCITSQ